MGDYSLLVVLDGLRRDYLTPELTPTICSLGQEGIVNDRHYASFPSKTRVQAATIATGTNPGSHGIVDNILWLPAVADEPLSMEYPENHREIDRSTDEGAVTTPSLGEVLAENDTSLFAAGSCSPGTNHLLNHTGAGHGLYNAAGYVVPEDRKAAVTRTVGPFPPLSHPNTERNSWAVDAYLDLGLNAPQPPDVSILWLSEPDKATHRHGVGHPNVLEAVRDVDNEVRRVLEGLERHGVREVTDVIVLADHGFSTDSGSLDLGDIMARHEVAERTTVVGYHIHLADPTADRVAEIVTALRSDPGVGAIFTDTDIDGLDPTAVPSTFDRSIVDLDHPRAGEIVVAPAWSEQTNEHGYPGMTARSKYAGSHGTLSPHEMRVSLTGVGPAFKEGGIRANTVTGHRDLAPLLLHLQGISPPEAMDGRIPHELLATGHDNGTVAIEYETLSPNGKGPSGDVTVKRAVVGDSRYPLEIQSTWTRSNVRSW